VTSAGAVTDGANPAVIEATVLGTHIAGAVTTGAYSLVTSTPVATTTTDTRVTAPPLVIRNRQPGVQVAGAVTVGGKSVVASVTRPVDINAGAVIVGRNVFAFTTRSPITIPKPSVGA
jgi:hypothetical protein